MKRTLVVLAVCAATIAATAAAATETLTLTASPTTVTYGKTTTLSGQLTPAQANQNVTIEAQQCGTAAFKKITNVKTNATGVYTTTVMPAMGTTYRATLRSAQSPTVLVKVRPLVKLTRQARRSFTASVTAGSTLVGKSLVFQRFSTLRHKWVRVKNVTLTTAVNGTKPTVVSSVSFHSKVRARTRVRVLLTLAQAQPCYVSAHSNTVRA
jgi:hypothetical protein